MSLRFTKSSAAAPQTRVAGVRRGGATVWSLALLGCILAEPARSDVIVSVANSLSPLEVGSLFADFNRPVATSFTVGTSNVLLESIVLPLGNNEDHQVEYRNATVAIYSDASGVPGSALDGSTVTLNYQSNSPLADRTFALTSPVALVANTTYWLYLSQTNGDLTTQRTVLASVDTSIVSTYATPDEGVVRNSTWIGDDPGNNDLNWDNASLVYQLNGTAVPEASTLVFLGVCTGGVACAAAWRRRKGECARVAS